MYFTEAKQFNPLNVTSSLCFLFSATDFVKKHQVDRWCMTNQPPDTLRQKDNNPDPTINLWDIHFLTQQKRKKGLK